MTSSPLLDPAARLVIAHRGASAEAPENTLESFALAVRHGADALELDIRQSRDGMPVVLHDPTLDRTTDRTGTVAERSLAELQRADAGARCTADGGLTFPWRGRGVTIPSLAEVLDAFPAVPLLIELKTRAAQDAVLAVLRHHGAVERCVVAAADHRALRRIRGGAVPLGASRRDIALFSARALLGVPPARLDYRVFAVPETYRGLPVPTARFIRAARRLGRPVHVWTVNRPSAGRALWERGAAGVITDRPGAMREERERWQEQGESG